MTDGEARISVLQAPFRPNLCIGCEEVFAHLIEIFHIVDEVIDGTGKVIAGLQAVVEQPNILRDHLPRACFHDLWVRWLF